MTRSNRIKAVRFNAFAVDATELANTYADINGEVLKITFNGITSPGSFWIAESGTGVEFWRRNNITSGINAFEVYPRVQVTDSINTTLNHSSGNTWSNRVSLGPIYLAASGLTSGVGKLFGPVVVSYI